MRREQLNRVIGDDGFIARYGRAPGASDRDLVRIRAHLRHVIGLLQGVDTSRLCATTRAARARCLELLSGYAAQGRFPQNHYTPYRNPVFVDAGGRACAVGHLIAQTVGRDVTERIAKTHRLDFIDDIHDPIIDEWAAAHGFDRRELAMIQPSYGEVTAALAPKHFAIAAALMPLWTLVVATAVVTKSKEMLRFVAIASMLWGCAMLVVIPLMQFHVLALFLVLYKIPGAVFFGMCGYMIFRSIKGEEPPSRAPQYTLLIALVVTSITLIVSVTPIHITHCASDPERWTYQTNFGFWWNLVSPSSASLDAFRGSIEPIPSGIGNARGCPAPRVEVSF